MLDVEIIVNEETNDVRVIVGGAGQLTYEQVMAMIRAYTDSQTSWGTKDW